MSRRSLLTRIAESLRLFERATPPQGILEAAADLLPDVPLSKSTQDLLGRAPFARRIAEVLRDRRGKESLVIAIYGRWGDGKTTVLRFVEEALGDERSRISFIRFNPWLIDHQDEILKSFFETLASGLGYGLTTRRAAVVKALRDYSGYLAPLMPPMEALHRASAGIATRSIEDHKKRVSHLLQQANHHVAVAIDDIDRLDREEIASS